MNIIRCTARGHGIKHINFLDFEASQETNQRGGSQNNRPSCATIMIMAIEDFRVTHYPPPGPLPTTVLLDQRSPNPNGTCGPTVTRFRQNESCI